MFGQGFPMHVGWLRLPYFDWPTCPAWLYRLTQECTSSWGWSWCRWWRPWSVIPKLFAWPPVRSLAQLLERVTLLLLVGGILFEIATGVLDIQYDYVFGFNFYIGHYYGAWVFTGAFAAHGASSCRACCGRCVPGRCARNCACPAPKTRPEPADPDGLVAPAPGPATLSRRGVLAVVGGGSALIAVLTAGQTIGGTARRMSLLAPRGGYRDSPDDFPVNHTAAAAGSPPATSATAGG